MYLKQAVRMSIACWLETGCFSLIYKIGETENSHLVSILKQYSSTGRW
jgi:hypothetical protein